jgi:hypothetical protein
MISSQLLEDLANTTTNFAIAAILLAVLTAIFMQALYEIFLRGQLQRRWVRDWIRQRLMRRTRKDSDREFRKKTGGFLTWLQKWLDRLTLKPSDPEASAKADEILDYLEGEGEEKSIYSLNYQQLCGQIASRVQREIEEPQETDLLLAFALDMTDEEIENLRLKKDLPRTRRRTGKTESGEAMDEMTSLRQRVLFHAEKGVDDLQIKLGRLWRENNYLLNLLFSIGLTLFLSLLATQFQFRFTEQSWVLLSVGGAGGLFAPIASNVLERVFYPR